MKTASYSTIPKWQTIAAGEIQAIMKCWGLATLSSLHKDGCIDYTTLKKLDPKDLNPTLTLSATLRMFVKLYLVAGETLEGDKRERTQARLTQALMQVAAAGRDLTESDREKIEERKRINGNKH